MSGGRARAKRKRRAAASAASGTAAPPSIAQSVRRRRASVAPQLSRIAGAPKGRREDAMRRCRVVRFWPRSLAAVAGSRGPAPGAAPTRRRSRSSCITAFSAVSSVRTTSSWRPGRARSKRIRTAASASIFFRRCSSAARRRSFSIRPATASSISSGRRRAARRAASPRIEIFELPFVSSRRALVNSKAIQDFAAANLQDEFREVHPICFSCRDRGVVHTARSRSNRSRTSKV